MLHFKVFEITPLIFLNEIVETLSSIKNEFSALAQA